MHLFDKNTPAYLQARLPQMLNRYEQELSHTQRSNSIPSMCEAI
jgi:hypothetical protein